MHVSFGWISRAKVIDFFLGLPNTNPHTHTHKKQQEATMPPKEDQPNPRTKSVSFHGGGDGSGMAPRLSSSPPRRSTFSSSSSIHLRWSRIQKIVTIKETNSGLIRGSIAATTPPTKLAQQDDIHHPPEAENCPTYNVDAI